MREVSAGAVIFREDKERKYLILHYESGHWDFAKGNIEKGENEKDTIKREVKEETGIGNIKFINGLKEKISYFYKHKGKTIFKEVIFYLVETKEEKVKLSHEHIGYEWLNYENSLKRLTFANARKIIKKANKLLESSKKKN